MNVQGIRLRKRAAEIVIELALCRQRLSSLTEALAMLIELVIDTDSVCTLNIDGILSNSGLKVHRSPLAAPTEPPAGLGILNSFTVTKPSMLGATVRSQRRVSPLTASNPHI